MIADKSVSFSFFFNGASVAERPDESAYVVYKIANDNELKKQGNKLKLKKRQLITPWQKPFVFLFYIIILHHILG